MSIRIRILDPDPGKILSLINFKNLMLPYFRFFFKVRVGGRGQEREQGGGQGGGQGQGQEQGGRRV